MARVRRKLRDACGHKVKVGHTGTLDPFATGLLILLSGTNTKRSADFLKLDKTYEATLRLGFVSSTGDPEGEITPIREGALANSSFPEPVELSRANPSLRSGRARDPLQPEAVPEKTIRSAPDCEPLQPEIVAPPLAEVKKVLQSLTGTTEQKVPKFSAVKINGRRAYQLAREGQDFETPTRKVTVYQIKILAYRYPELKIRCEVSSGTYIRTLAEDIGAALGTGAYLTALRRTCVGNYRVEDARPLD